MKLSNYSHLSRTLDLKYPHHKAIIGLTLGVFCLGTIAQLVISYQVVESLIWGITAALGVFFAWALSREIDPDRPGSALLSAGLFIVSLYFIGLPNLAWVLWLLLLLRLVNRTTGLPPTKFDLAGLVALTFYIILNTPSSLIPTFPSGYVVIALGVIILASLILIKSYKTVTSKADLTHKPLNPKRIQAGILVATGIGVLITFWYSNQGFANLTPLWNSLIASLLYRQLRPNTTNAKQRS